MLRHRDMGVWFFFKQEFKSTNITKIQNAPFLLHASAAESSGCYMVFSYTYSCVALQIITLLSVELVNCKVKSSQTPPFAFGLFFFFAPPLFLLKQVTSLLGYLKYCHKALPTLVFLPGLTWLYDADRRLHHCSGQGSEHRHAGGEYGNAQCPVPREHMLANEVRMSPL